VSGEPATPEAPRRIDLRWRDFDVYGHVNNAVYLFFLEDTRDAWLGWVLDDPDATMRFVVARAAIDYRAGVERGAGHVTGECELRRLGQSSVTTREVIRAPDGEVAAEAEVVLVAHDPDTGRSRPLTEPERARLDAVWRNSDS
jgi:acyl-CoA thioester hydrolase